MDAIEEENEGPMRLTECAHDILSSVIQPGDIVIDATAGNGVDTQFLAEQVGPDGRVFAFDIQQDAIDQTALRLMNADLANVTLFCVSHSEMFEYIPPEYHGFVKAIMFNLGYLPKGDKRLITQPATSIAALEQAVQLLAPGAMLTILLYPGHFGGDAEAAAVEEWCQELDDEEFQLDSVMVDDPVAPRLYILRKLDV
ncbi:MAG: class I SAM-dependent methyltransferase [Planctomycetaceae bacterium]|nr:class I SAM-dependent methyltransferase [Planctomycetaceae bacterium]